VRYIWEKDLSLLWELRYTLTRKKPLISFSSSSSPSLFLSWALSVFSKQEPAHLYKYFKPSWGNNNQTTLPCFWKVYVGPINSNTASKLQFLDSVFISFSNLCWRRSWNGVKSLWLTDINMASHRIGETGLSDSGPSSSHHHHLPYAVLHGMNNNPSTSFMYDKFLFLKSFSMSWFLLLDWVGSSFVFSITKTHMGWLLNLSDFLFSLFSFFVSISGIRKDLLLILVSWKKQLCSKEWRLGMMKLKHVWYLPLYDHFLIFVTFAV